MAKRDCMHCKNCILKPMAYHDGVTNSCRFDNRFRNMSQKELFEHIITKECVWFEKGEPEYSDNICYDD